MSDGITCSTCTTEKKTKITLVETTPTGRQKKMTVKEQVPTSFDGTEEEAYTAGWVLDEYGFLCPNCNAAKTAAEAQVETDPTDGASATIHSAIGQLSAQQVRDAHIVAASERGHILDRLLSSNRGFEVRPEAEGGFFARFIDETDEWGRGQNTLVALFELQESMRPVTAAAE